MKIKGVPACTVQPFFEGVAISTGGSNKLEFNSPGALTFFDGNVEYELQNISGDAWLAFRLVMGTPKLTPTKLLDNLICVPSANNEKASTRDKAAFIVELTGKIFIKNDVSNDGSENDGELLILSVIDEFVVKFDGVIEINVGTLAAALRIRSAKPACFPSGIFFAGDISPVVKIGPKVSPFLSFDVDLEFDRKVSAGVTWLDQGEEVKPEEYIQSFFYKEERELDFLGISFDSFLEFQYFDDKEFTRRKDFNTTACCPEGGEFTNCNIDDTGFAKLVKSGNFQPQPTFGMFTQLEDMSFFESKSTSVVFLFVSILRDYANTLNLNHV